MLASALSAERFALALAFNVKIKQELERRFPSNFTVKTLNGLGHSAWARFLGRNPEVSDRKLGQLITSLARAQHLDLPGDTWHGVKALVTAAMNAGLVPSVFPVKNPMMTDTGANWVSLSEDNYLDLEEPLISFARAVLIASVKLGFGTGTSPCISFDDQIYLPTCYGAPFPSFPLVLVDEAQDLSPLQHEMVKRAAKDRLIVVGDPRQAIYGFRGADTASMGKLRALREDWIDLPLTLTFRCPKVVVALQQRHAPGFTAAEGNKEGEILDLREEDSWCWYDLPQSDLAVLCRNNAPLISLALRLLSKGISCHMLGRDIGKGLIALAKKICPRGDAAACADAIRSWQLMEESLARANEKEHKISGISDRAESLFAVLEFAKDAEGLQETLKEIFARDFGKVTLSSIHRAKGLEWPSVLHLDPWRIPSKWARKAAQAGHPAQLQQEMNLRYVAETRTKEKLILASLDKMTFERKEQ